MSDIVKANSSNEIKNGTTVVSCGKTNFIKYDKYVQNIPSLDSIENKYIDRFDDPSYYFGYHVHT